MDGRNQNQVAFAGQKTPGPCSVWPFGVWSRLFASFAPFSLASGRCVGDRPLPGKETAATLVAHIGSWGLPRYEQLGHRAVTYRGCGLFVLR
jgi:hypothetical protein